MPLNNEQIDRIARLFGQAYFGNVYTACMGFLSPEQQGNFPTNGTLPNNISVARKAIEVLCESSPGQQQHPLLALLDALDQGGNFNPGEYDQLVLTVTAMPIQIQNQIFGSLLMDRFAFVNRSDLKEILKNMSRGTNHDPILTINGPAKSGKSYSSLLLKDYCRQKDDVLLCEIKMDGQNFRDITVESICRDLMLKLSHTDELDLNRTANLSAWCEDIACKIIRQVNVLLSANTYSQIWFFLDGFESNLLEHEDYEGEKEKTSKFLQCFYSKFTDGIISKKCRLILSGYTAPILNNARFSHRPYTNKPVSEIDVKEVVRTILTKTDNIDQSEIDKITEEVFKEQFASLSFPISSLDVLETPFNEITMAALT